MKKPTDAELRDARADFKALLSANAAERVWQTFFARNPFVLSRGLPLRLEPCDILPLGRDGRSEPDFLIYPGSDRSAPLHGLIELKTPGSRIVTLARRNVLSLTRDAACAVRQLQIYDRDYDRFSPVKRCLSFSSHSHLFIIMGLTAQLSRLSQHEALAAQFAELLPPQIRLLTFDELLCQYENGLPLRSFFLLSAAPSFDTSSDSTGTTFSWDRARARIRRSALHARFGGSRHCGITASTRSPNVFLFHRPGRDYGDSWREDGCFHYAGVGQRGDQQMSGMNRIVLEAAQNARALRLFEYLDNGEVEYQGRFDLDPASPYYLEDRVDSDGLARQVIRFRLRPNNEEPLVA